MESTYTFKAALIKALSVICRQLQANPDNRAAIVSKLTEELSRCAEGLHDRCTEIILSFTIPDNFQELLQLVRESLVVSTANALADDVHVQNTIISIASTDTYGVRPRNRNDSYYGDLTPEVIKKQL